MKISRHKKSHKTLMFYTTNFNYREPYQVLIDATFCQAALQHKILIEEQLKNYLQTQLKFLTTQCIILEAESLGPQLIGATQIVKKFMIHKCGHEGKPVSAAECIKQMTKDSCYIVASQDETLQKCLRKIPGRCLLYLHRSIPVLESPSLASKKYVQRRISKCSAYDVEKVIELKGVAGLSENKKPPLKIKRNRPKNPNPLSCKKSKKLKQQEKNRQNLKIKRKNGENELKKPEQNQSFVASKAQILTRVKRREDVQINALSG